MTCTAAAKRGAGKMYRWRIKARVKGRMVIRNVKDNDIEKVKRKARELFPRHKLKNITITLIK